MIRTTTKIVVFIYLCMLQSNKLKLFIQISYNTKHQFSFDKENFVPRELSRNLKVFNVFEVVELEH